MRKLLVVILGIIFVGTAGCAKSLYRTWGEQLRDLPLHNGRAEDVSMLLGAAPTKCEPFENPSPRIGMTLAPEKTLVTKVVQNSPAYRAGIRPGDIVMAIAARRVETYAQAQSAFRDSLFEGQPIEIETNRGVVSLIPIKPKAEQCYWEVQAGRVAKTGSYGAVNRYGGSSPSGGSAYERFCRASCRIIDGYVAGCRANWQE
jgi:hypothetical protein